MHALVSILLLHAPVAAEPATTRPVVLVVPTVPQTDDEVDALYAAFAARGVDGVEPMARVGVDRPLAPTMFAPPSLDEVKDQLFRARAALNDFDADGAASALAEGEGLLLRLERPELAGALYADLLLAEADLALSMGDRARASDALRLLARLEPERAALHPGVYPPLLVEAYAEARAANDEARDAPLVVVWPRVAADDAGVWIDLVPVPRDTVPARIAAGPHVLTAAAPGALTVSTRVVVVEDEPVVFAPTLVAPGADRERAAAVDAITRAPDDIAALARLGEATGANVIFVVGALHRVWAPDVGVHPLAVQTGDPLTLATDALATLERARRPPVVDEGADAVEPPSAWPLAIGGGVGAAVVVAGALTAGAVTLLYVFRPREEPPPEPARPIVFRGFGEGQ